MSILDLSDITLMTYATRNHASARHALRRCVDVARFRDVRVYSDRSDWLDDGWKHCPIAPFPVRGEPAISQWFLRELMNDADEFGRHLLIVHWDGFIVNPSAWDPAWRQFDYIGAPWQDGHVGNNGFCLMSRKLCTAIRLLNIPPAECWPADVTICREQSKHHQLLKRVGFRFAPTEIARRFSVEAEAYRGSFGFHGVHTLADVVRQGLYIGKGNS